MKRVRDAAARGAAVATGGMVHLFLVPAGHQVEHFHFRPAKKTSSTEAALESRSQNEESMEVEKKPSHRL
jgi:hypothetical protein